MGVAGSDKNKTKLACILEANESTRMRMVNSEPPNHEDHIAGKGENSLQHYNLVHKFYSYASSYENSSSESSSGQGMGKIGEKFGVETLLNGDSQQSIACEVNTGQCRVSVRRTWMTCG